MLITSQFKATLMYRSIVREIFSLLTTPRILSRSTPAWKSQRRYSLNTIPSRNGWAVIHVQLEDMRSLTILLGDRFNDWRQRAARSTPSRPEIYHHGLLCLQNDTLEITFAHLINMPAHVRSPCFNSDYDLRGVTRLSEL
jgi:hypothetical protein